MCNWDFTKFDSKINADGYPILPQSPYHMHRLLLRLFQSLFLSIFPHTSVHVTSYCTAVSNIWYFLLTIILWCEAEGRHKIILKWKSINSVITTLHKSSDHYNDVIMGEIASQITSRTIVYSTVYSDADQRKHQSFTSVAFCREFTAQMCSNAEKVSIWWRHHVNPLLDVIDKQDYITWSCDIL